MPVGLLPLVFGGAPALVLDEFALEFETPGASDWRGLEELPEFVVLEFVVESVPDFEQPVQKATTARSTSKAMNLRISFLLSAKKPFDLRERAGQLAGRRCPASAYIGRPALPLKAGIFWEACVSPPIWYCRRLFQSRILSTNSHTVANISYFKLRTGVRCHPFSEMVKLARTRFRRNTSLCLRHSYCWRA